MSSFCSLTKNKKLHHNARHKTGQKTYAGVLRLRKQILLFFYVANLSSELKFIFTSFSPDNPKLVKMLFSGQFAISGCERGGMIKF